MIAWPQHHQTQRVRVPDSSPMRVADGVFWIVAIEIGPDHGMMAHVDFASLFYRRCLRAAGDRGGERVTVHL